MQLWKALAVLLQRPEEETYAGFCQFLGLDRHARYWIVMRLGMQRLGYGRRVTKGQIIELLHTMGFPASEQDDLLAIRTMLANGGYIEYHDRYGHATKRDNQWVLKKLICMQAMGHKHKSMWEPLAVLCGNSSCQSIEQFCRSLGITEGFLHRWGACQMYNNAVSRAMNTLGYSHSMESIHKLMDELAFPCTGDQSILVCVGMVRMSGQLKGVEDHSKTYAGLEAMLVNVLLVLKKEGYRYHHHVETGVGRLPSSRRRKGANSTMDSSCVSATSPRCRACKTLCCAIYHDAQVVSNEGQEELYGDSGHGRMNDSGEGSHSRSPSVAGSIHHDMSVSCGGGMSDPDASMECLTPIQQDKGCDWSNTTPIMAASPSPCMQDRHSESRGSSLIFSPAVQTPCKSNAINAMMGSDDIVGRVKAIPLREQLFGQGHGLQLHRRQLQFSMSDSDASVECLTPIQQDKGFDWKNTTPIMAASPSPCMQDRHSRASSLIFSPAVQTPRKSLARDAMDSVGRVRAVPLREQLFGQGHGLELRRRQLQFSDDVETQALGQGVDMCASQLSEQSTLVMTGGSSQGRDCSEMVREHAAGQTTPPANRSPEHMVDTDQSGRRTVPRKGRKPEVQAAQLARELGHVVPPHTSIYELSRIIGVRWSPGGRQQYGKNRRRVIAALQEEQIQKQKDDDIVGLIRAELERCAVAQGFMRQDIQAATVEQLQELIRGASTAEMGGGTQAASVGIQDLQTLGNQPLGTPLKMPGKRALTEEEKQAVQTAREQHKRKHFRDFVAAQDGIRWSTCDNCMEVKLQTVEYEAAREQACREAGAKWCKRCNVYSKAAVKPYEYWNKDNSAHFSDVPQQLADLTDIEAMLIARIVPVFRVQILKGGVVKSCGNTVAFPQDISELATVLPRLPHELQYVFVRRATQRHSTNQKSFKVRRSVVLEALNWLKTNNEFYRDIVIDQSRIGALPVDGNVEGEMLDKNFVPAAQEGGEDAFQDMGPAPAQLHMVDEMEPAAQDVSQSDDLEDMRDGGVINVGAGGEEAKESLFRALREAISPDEVMAASIASRQVALDSYDRQQSAQQPPQPTATHGEVNAGGRSNPINVTRMDSATQVRVNEKCVGYYTMAFPTLIPDGVGDFTVSRKHPFKSLDDWAEHCIWWKDGRFAKHPFFKFVVMNIIQRGQARTQSTFFVGARLGEAAPSVQELKEKVANRDESLLRTCISYASNIKGTDPYWYDRRKDLEAMVHFQIWRNNGLPSFFLTGSCAEFHWTPLIKLLKELLERKGDTTTDIVNDLFARRRVVKQYCNVVCDFFHKKTEMFIEHVLKPVYGVSDYYLRYEFAESRGQIHFHMLAWRGDGLPHGLLQQAVVDGACYRKQWEHLVFEFFKDLGFTAHHPSGDKGLWPKPEGTFDQEGDSEYQRCLEKTFEEIQGNTNLLSFCKNKTMIHCCNPYCLKKKRDGNWECRMGFGSKDSMAEGQGKLDELWFGRKRLTENFYIRQDPKGYLVGEMPRSHPRIVQHINEFPALWGGNCDQTVIISSSDPKNPDPREMRRSVSYCTGYLCKNKDKVGGTVLLYKSVLEDVPEELEHKNIKTFCEKCMNKSVGKQEVSSPNADSFLSKLPLIRSSRQFVSVSLGSDRIIGIQRGQQESHHDSGEETRPRLGSTRMNARDRYVKAAKEGTFFYDIQGQPKSATEMSLYEFASGPLQGPNVHVGTWCPVPKGCNVQASWPITLSYARSMLMLHKPGCVKGQDEQSEQGWLAEFDEFRESEHCPAMVKAAVLKAEEEHQKFKNALHSGRGGQGGHNSDDSEDEAGVGQHGNGDQGMEDDDDDSNEACLWAEAFGFDGGNDCDGCLEGAINDDDLYMGIDDNHDWSSVSRAYGSDMDSITGHWTQFKACLTSTDEGSHSSRRCLEGLGWPAAQGGGVSGSGNQSKTPVTEADIQRLTASQKAAVMKVLKHMLEIREKKDNPEALACVKPLRLIIAGTAGTGKSRVIHIINSLGKCLLGGKAVANVAPSGTAAFLIGGCTIHSLFPIPIGHADKTFKKPSAARMQKLQDDLAGLFCLCVDERSMVGSKMFGWVEYLLRMGMHRGGASDQDYGGLKILLLFGDDGQLPPVRQVPMFSKKVDISSSGGPALSGRTHYRAITDCIFLTDVVRQANEPCPGGCTQHAVGEACSRFRDILLKVRYGAGKNMGNNVGCEPVCEGDVTWLQQRSLHRLSTAEQDRFLHSSDSLWIYPRKEDVQSKNAEKIILASRNQIPVVKCLAYDEGKCCKKALKHGNGEFGQMDRVTYLFQGAKVMLTTNLHTNLGLFNGAVGEVRDIYYAPGRQPSKDGKEHPDVVFVEFPSYCGPSFFPGYSGLNKTVPIGTWRWQEPCKHHGDCFREQFPLRPAWAITCHKSQGMTIGDRHYIKHAVIALGKLDTEKWAPGAAFVQLSRVTGVANLAIEGTVDGDRFSYVRFPSKRMVAEEDERLYRLHQATLANNSWLFDDEACGKLLSDVFGHCNNVNV